MEETVMSNENRRDMAVNMLKDYLKQVTKLVAVKIALREVLEDKHTSDTTKTVLWGLYEEISVDYKTVKNNAEFWSKEADKAEEALKEELIKEVEEQEREETF